MTQSANDVRIKEQKDTISQLNKTIENLNRTIELLHKQISDNETLMAEMKAEMALLRKKLYGSSKERTVPVDSDQLNFFSKFENEPEPIPEIIEPEFIEVTYKRSRKKKPTLEEQFKDIPVKQVFINNLTDEDKICPVCDAAMKSIGTEIIRREVVHVKPSMYMVEYIATTYSCPVCKDTEDPQFIKDGEAPKALIEGSYVSPSLAAWAFYQKFAMSVPFYRLEKSFEELGAKISRTTMANWAIQCNERYFKPMTEYFHRKLLERKFLMMDETPLQVLNEPNKRPESKSYVWLMRSGEDGQHPIVYYRYSPSRNRRNFMLTFLEDGRCSLSNNPSENSIRPITVGRKNWLFSNSVEGAEASMGIYTIVEMAKLHGISQYRYLEYLLENRPSANMTDEELDKLVPWNEDVQKVCCKCENSDME